MSKKKEQTLLSVKKFKPNANSSLSSLNSSEVEVSQTSSTVTRSGRTSYRSLCTDFDYSTTDPEEVRDEENPKDSNEEDGYSGDPNYTISTNPSSSSTNANHKLIYLDLSEPITKITREPSMDPLIAEDKQLITKLKKLLGLSLPRRKLYNPSDNDGRYEEQALIQLDSPSTTSRVYLHPTDRTWPTLNILNTNNISSIERKWKMFHDYLMRINAFIFAKTKMQSNLWRESLDLTNLPSRSRRNQLCRHHMSCKACLEEYPLSYSFVESLNPEIPLNMCHPMAVGYRIKDLQQLAKQLFNMFNHRIFYCGLYPKLNWKSLKLSTTNFTVFGKNASRSATIILDVKIQKPASLVKTLLHEMCHAAAFVYNSEIGHGDNCRKWSYLAKFLMPELPLVEDCDPTYKYTCYLCGAFSFGRIVELIDGILHLHCAYCQFEVMAEPWQSNDPHFWSPTETVMTPYKEFIKSNYLTPHTELDISNHNEKMLQLNLQYLQQLNISSICEHI